MGIDKKVFLTEIKQEAIDVVNLMPENYCELLENKDSNLWAVQIHNNKRKLLNPSQQIKIVFFPDDFHPEMT